MYIRYFSREITIHIRSKYTVIYGADIRFWPTLNICTVHDHIVGGFPAKNTVYIYKKIPCMYIYMYGPGQP
jgi:hypothetical protein